jgi:hypothetical protein
VFVKAIADCRFLTVDFEPLIQALFNQQSAIKNQQFFPFARQATPRACRMTASSALSLEGSVRPGGRDFHRRTARIVTCDLVRTLGFASSLPRQGKCCSGKGKAFAVKNRSLSPLFDVF